MSHAALLIAFQVVGDIPPAVPGTSYVLPRPLPVAIGGLALSAAMVALMWVFTRRRGGGQWRWTIAIGVSLLMTWGAALYSQKVYSSWRSGGPVRHPEPRPQPELLPPIEVIDDIEA